MKIAPQFQRYLDSSYNNLDIDIDELDIADPPKDDSHTTRMELEELDSIVQEAKLPRDIMQVADKDPLRLFYSVAKKKGLDPLEEEAKLWADDWTKLSFEFKLKFKRRRPYEVKKEHDIDFVVNKSDTTESPSYPSGHAMMAYGVAEFYKDKYPLMVDEWDNVAEIIAHSRLQMGVHYPSDVESSKKIVDQVTENIKEASAARFARGVIKRNLKSGKGVKVTTHGGGNRVVGNTTHRYSMKKPTTPTTPPTWGQRLSNAGNAVGNLIKEKPGTTAIGTVGIGTAGVVGVNKLRNPQPTTSMQKFNSAHNTDKTAAEKLRLYHGSPLDLETLEPRQPNKGRWGEHGLYGATDPLVAALYAIARNDSRGSWGILPDGRLIAKSKKDLNPEGYVYEYESDDYIAPPEDDPGIGYATQGTPKVLSKKKVYLDQLQDSITRVDDRDKFLEYFKKTSSQRLRTTIFGVDPKGNLLHGFSDQGFYKFPGGGVDPGESIVDAAKRELLEEAGYEVDSIEELQGLDTSDAVAANSTKGHMGHGSSLTKYLLARLGNRNESMLGIEGDAISNLRTAPIQEVLDGLEGDMLFGSSVAESNHAALSRLRDVLEKTSADQQKTSAYKDYRPRGTLYLLDGKGGVMADKPTADYNSTTPYFFPGGGIFEEEKVDRLPTRDEIIGGVEREALEELGTKLKNVRVLQDEPANVDMPDWWRERQKKKRGVDYKGIAEFFAAAERGGLDKSIYGADNDEFKGTFYPIDEVATALEANAKPGDDYYEDSMRQARLLRSLLEKTSSEQPLLRHRSTLLIRDPETNKLLAAKETDPSSKASPFYFPGGGLYEDEYDTPRNPSDEDIIEGARREALEELGIHLDNPRVVGSYAQELEDWWKEKTLKNRGVPYLGAHEHYVLADKGKEDRSLYNIEGDAFEQGDYYDPSEIVEALSRVAKGDSTFAPFNREQVRAIKDNLLKKNASDLSVLTAVPKQNLDLIMRKGLASQKAISEDPELTKAFLDQRGYKEEEWRKELSDALKGFKPDSRLGASVFFSEPDPDKVSDPRHFINQFDTTKLRVNLGKLLKDIPETRFHGVELEPFNEEAWEADPDNYPSRRHRDLTTDEIAALIAKDPKELWKHYKDEYIGKLYAGDVPHGMIVTPSGIIPPEYLELVEKTSSEQPLLRHRATLLIRDPDTGKLLVADNTGDPRFTDISPFSFPGGGVYHDEYYTPRTPTEEDIIEGARREALEELGIGLANPRVVGSSEVLLPEYKQKAIKSRKAPYEGKHEHYVLADKGPADSSLYNSEGDAFTRGQYVDPKTIYESLIQFSKGLNSHAPLNAGQAKAIKEHLLSKQSSLEAQFLPEYLELVEKTSAYKDYRPRGTLYLLDGKGGVMADKPTSDYDSTIPYFFPGGGIFEEESVDRLPTSSEIVQGVEREALEELGTKLKNVRVLQDEPSILEMPDWWRERQKKKRGVDYKGIAEFFAAAERGDQDKSIYGADNDEFKGTFYPIDEVASAIEANAKPGDDYYEDSMRQARLLRSLLEKTSSAKEQLRHILKKKAALEDEFQPDLTPDDLKALGVYDQVYGDAPSEASMKEWPEHWINKQDPLGWLQWYERYSGGRRTEDDARQIKRWKSFKARHLAQYLKNPTPRRAAALRNWGIDVENYR